MNSYQIRFISKFVFAIFLAHICLVFVGIAADCSYYERQVEIELDDLEDAQRDLKKLQDKGYLPSVTVGSYVGAAGTALAGGVVGTILPGGGTVLGALGGYIGGGITGAIGGAVSHYSALRDAEAAVEQAQQDYDEAVQNLENCRNSSQSSATSS